MKKIQKQISALFLGLLLCIPLSASIPLRCYPVAIEQPDGTSIICFYSTSDYCSIPEFCDELLEFCEEWPKYCDVFRPYVYHDADGYIFIRNSENHYYYYAIVENEGLKVSDYIVGEVDPKTISELKPSGYSCTPPDLQNFLGKYTIKYTALVNKGDGYKAVEGASGAYEIEITAYRENSPGIQFFFNQRGIDGYVKAIVHYDYETRFEIFGQAFPSYPQLPRTVIHSDNNITGNVKGDSIYMTYHIYSLNDENVVTEDTLYNCRGKKIVSAPYSGTGKLIVKESPCTTESCVTCMALYLQTISADYFLSICDDKITVDGIEYFEGDEVEITGKVTTKQDINSIEYIELEIETIKKIDVGVSHVLSSGSLIAYTQDNGIVVQNIPEDEIISVYNAAGMAIATTTAGDGETFIPLSIRGLYLVKVGEETVRVVF